MSHHIFPIEDIIWRKGCKPRQCPTCHKVFLARIASIKGNKKTFCSRTCQSGLVSDTEKRCTKCHAVKALDMFPDAKHTRTKKQSWCKSCTNASTRQISRRNKKKWERSTNKKLCAVKGCTNIANFEHPRCGMHQYGVKEVPNPFKGKTEKFAERIVPYKQSPTGKAYIGVAKAPLMKAVGGGHGFQGVLLQNEDRSLVQCHHCGEWRRALTAHVKSCTGLTTKQYKEKYGLLFTKGLGSEADSLYRTEKLLSGEIHSFKKGNTHTPHRTYAHNTRETSMAEMNRTATCPLQVKARIIEFIHASKELPRSSNRGNKIYSLLYKRFGSFRKGMDHYGLPHPVSNFNGRLHSKTGFMFPGNKIYRFNTLDIAEREAFYQLMVQKCPVLSEKIS